MVNEVKNIVDKGELRFLGGQLSGENWVFRQFVFLKTYLRSGSFRCSAAKSELFPVTGWAWRRESTYVAEVSIVAT